MKGTDLTDFFIVLIDYWTLSRDCYLCLVNFMVSIITTTEKSPPTKNLFEHFRNSGSSIEILVISRSNSWNFSDIPPNSRVCLFTLRTKVACFIRPDTETGEKQWKRRNLEIKETTTGKTLQIPNEANGEKFSSLGVLLKSKQIGL